MSDTDDNRNSGSDFEDDGQITSSGTLRLRHFITIVIVAIAVGGALYMWHRSTRKPPAPEAPEGVTVVPEGSRTVSLYFADKETATLVTETRLVAVGKETADQIAQIVRALLEGPQGEAGVSAIPEGTRLLNAFYDSQAGAAYLDFSSELVAGHPGGSSAEYYTIAAIVRTVSENFPEVQAVQLLVEGLQVGTLAGHVDIYGPLPVGEWR